MALSATLSRVSITIRPTTKKGGGSHRSCTSPSAPSFSSFRCHCSHAARWICCFSSSTRSRWFRYIRRWAKLHAWHLVSCDTHVRAVRNPIAFRRTPLHPHTASEDECQERSGEGWGAGSQRYGSCNAFSVGRGVWIRQSTDAGIRGVVDTTHQRVLQDRSGHVGFRLSSKHSRMDPPIRRM